MDVRINAGYIITDSIHIGDVEFVLGVSGKEPSMFVTWECQGGSNCYWGHYTSDLTAAKRDLLERARCDLEFQERRKERTIKPPQKDNKERDR